jgi:hypothetical protein
VLVVSIASCVHVVPVRRYTTACPATDIEKLVFPDAPTTARVPSGVIATDTVPVPAGIVCSTANACACALADAADHAASMTVSAIARRAKCTYMAR